MLVGQQTASRGTVTVDLHRQSHEAVIVISDTGPGILEDRLTQIFEPLFSTKAQGRTSWSRCSEACCFALGVSQALRWPTCSSRASTWHCAPETPGRNRVDRPARVGCYFAAGSSL